MKEEILEYFKDINFVYNDCTRFDTLKRMLDELEQELKIDTLDRIKVEIADIYCGQYCENPLTADAVREIALEIIDKYKAESEEVKK